jgi:uncharacterized protein YndB with AHSA1/START domain
MAQQQVRFEQFFAAPRERVFVFFADHGKFGRLWPGKFRRIRDSADAGDPNGLGSVREIRSGGLTFEETVTAFDPPERIEYQVTKGSPIRNHLGRLLFTDEPGGTKLVYTIEFEPRIPLTGGLICSVLCASWHRRIEAVTREIVSAV